MLHHLEKIQKTTCHQKITTYCLLVYESSNFVVVSLQVLSSSPKRRIPKCWGFSSTTGLPRESNSETPFQVTVRISPPTVLSRGVTPTFLLQEQRNDSRFPTRVEDVRRTEPWSRRGRSLDRQRVT